MLISNTSSNQDLQTKSLLTTPQDILQTAQRNLSSNPINCRQKTHKQNLSKKWFLKNRVILTSISMPLSVTYHGPSTTCRVWDSVLGNTLRRITVFSSMVQPIGHLLIPWQSGQKDLRSIHRRCGIRYLLAFKTPCRSYTSKNTSTIGITALNGFPRKTYQSAKPIFKII